MSKDISESNKNLNDDLSEENSDLEQKPKKYKYPRAIPFIVLNEFCERFNYYGMRTVLVLYLTRKLGFDDDTATVFYHTETTLVYFCCFFGAILADSWLGKFRTIVSLSFVYVCGSTILAVGSIEMLNLPAVAFTIAGIALIALGSGGIKPCVAAFGGEQFVLPQQAKQLALFFSVFYFGINAGSLISTFITPILRSDVHCFGVNDCYPLAFGVPAVLMFTSIVIFLLGKPLYKIFPPQGNMFLKVCNCIGNAISTRSVEKETNPKEGWLNYAEEKYGRKLVLETKILLNILVLYLPLPLFWALFDQQGSRWTFQATRMDGDLGFMDIKPDQIQVLNPFLILIFIPLYEVVFYPILNLVGIRRPLQKLTLGGIFGGIAFVLSGLVELSLLPSYPVLPEQGVSQLRIFNSKPCNYTFDANLVPNLVSFEVASMSVFEEKYVKVESGKTSFSFNFHTQDTNPNCPTNIKGDFELQSGKAISYLLSGPGSVFKLEKFEDNPDKSRQGTPLVRIVSNVLKEPREFILRDKGGSDQFKHNETITKLLDVPVDTYEVVVDNVVAGKDLTFKVGGVYTVILQETSADKFDVSVVVITAPNSINILWQIPQYVILTLGEVMFSVTGLQFSFTQAPESMKSVLQGCWQLTVAFGNLIVVFVAGVNILSSQMGEFFLFAGLMFVDMILFAWLAYRYKPIPLEDLDKIDEEETLKEREKPLALDFDGSEDKSKF